MNRERVGPTPSSAAFDADFGPTRAKGKSKPEINFKCGGRRRPLYMCIFVRGE